MSGRDGILLAVILLVAAVLRLAGLNAPLWYDEIVTVDTHLRLPWTQMMQDYSMNHHYLHNLLAKLAITALGEAPWTVRLPALLFGLGSIWATWLLARDVAGRRVALVAAALMAVSYHEIWFSQNARGYTGLAFFSTLGFWLFLRGMALPLLSTWAGFGLTLAAAVFTHLTGAFFFAALGLLWIAVLIARRAGGPLLTRPLAGAALGVALAGILYLPVVPGMMRTVATVSETSAVDVMQEYQSPLWSAAEAIRTGLGEAGALNLLVGAAVLALSLAGAMRLRARSPLFAPAVVLHIGLTVAILMGLGMRIWPRFFFVDIGLLLILIVAGVEAVCLRLGRIGGQDAGRGLFVVAAIVMLALSSVLAARNWRAPKQDLAGAFAMVEAARQPGERIYAVGYAGNVFRSHFGADWGVIFTEAEYRAAVGQPGPITVVVAFPGRNFRLIPQLQADRGTVMAERAWLPGTLGDGGVAILHRD